MSAWIESHQALGQHPKTIRLAALLKCSLPCAVGHLHYLWWWALEYAQDGRIGRHESAVIAHACMWRGKPEVLIHALVTAGFVDEDGELIVHDWDDYTGRIQDRRTANRERQQAFRRRVRQALPNDAVTVTSQPAESLPNGSVAVTNNGVTGLPYLTVPNQTVPDLTVPNQTIKTAGSPTARQAARAREADPKLLAEHLQRISMERARQGASQPKIEISENGTMP